jgi:DNA-binding LytR/AlgR family response regulator
MRIAIVEDEKEQQETLKGYLRKFLDDEKVSYAFSVFENGKEFLSKFQPDYFDLIFMDIEFGKGQENGMEISKEIRKVDNDVLLIFVTNMAQFAVEGYSVDAIDFIVKPVLYDPFRMKMIKALKIYSNRSKTKNVLIQVENASKQILASDILYVEVSNHDLFYHTKDKEYKVRASLKEAIRRFEGLPFCQCNSCYLVNLEYVESVEKDHVVLSNGESLKMPRTRRKELLERLGDYLSGSRR